MQKRTLIVLVMALFGIVILGFVINKMRKDNLLHEITLADVSHLHDVKFYKDYLRDDSGLDVPISEPQDLDAFLQALKTIKPSGLSIKNLGPRVWYKVQLKLHVADERLLTLWIYRVESMGNTGVISITQGETWEVPGGIFVSEDLLQWAEQMEQKPGFESIKGRY